MFIILSTVRRIVNTLKMFGKLVYWAHFAFWCGQARLGGDGTNRHGENDLVRFWALCLFVWSPQKRIHFSSPIIDGISLFVHVIYSAVRIRMLEMKMSLYICGGDGEKINSVIWICRDWISSACKNSPALFFMIGFSCSQCFLLLALNSFYMDFI